MQFPSLHHYAAAKKLSESDNIEQLRYACLEIRTCIELLCYEQLERYKDMLPYDALSAWQPQRVIAMIDDCDPFGTTDSDIFMGINNPDGSAPEMEYMGTHRAINKKFLNKHYFRLSRHLHAPTLEAFSNEIMPTPSQIKAEINLALVELEPIAHRSFIARMVTLAYFKCPICMTENIKNKDKLSENEHVRCVNEKCFSEFRITNVSSEHPKFTIMGMTWMCRACQSSDIVYPHQVKSAGQKVQCKYCNAFWQVTTTVADYCMIGLNKM